eukprot:TRINITY_DN12249_c0_g1_i2.p1 TRINITY_DN12249_c0_g1~~TRINITY_DN12249_c0_g1_i2.p1  ORF type:complete len:113 (+),score=26.13 TRINITY_DN12249_c0_g1_i2:64-402(+)
MCIRDRLGTNYDDPNVEQELNEQKTPLIALAQSIYYKPALQLALDMFFRLRRADEMIHYLLKNGDVYTAISIINKYKIKSVDLQRLCKAAEKPNSTLHISQVMEFVNNYSKS